MPVPTSSHLSSRRRDALALLGLSSSAGPDDIKAAYRKQVLVYHPDRQQHDKEAATRTFIQIHEAYKLLIDSEDARASLKRRPSLRPEPEAEEQHARERDDSPGHADPQASSDDDQPRQAPSDDPPAQAPLSRSPSSQPPPQGQPQSQTPASESTSSQPPTSQSHTSPPPSSPHARSRTPSPNPHLFEAPRTPPSTPSESPPREESAAQPTTRAGVAPSAPPQSAPRNPQFHTPSAPPNSPAPRPPNAERTEPRVVTPPSFKEAATQSRYSSRPDSRYATNPDTYFTKPSPGAIYANTGYSPGPRYAFLDDDRPLPASAFESDGPTYKSPETRYATMPDSYFPNPITSPMPSVSGHSPGPRPHAFEEDLPLPPGVFEEDDEPFQRSSGSRYATQPDSYFPKPSPGGMPSSSGFSPGPRYAFMDDELPAAAFPDDTPTYKSPGTRYAMFPDDEYSRQAPVRQASRYASHPRYSARPSRQKDTEREARNDTLLNAFYSPRSQSTGTRYATVPDAFFPTPSPGARYNDIYSPGPRSAYLPEDPSPNPLYSPPYKSPETRYATNPDEHYTKPAAPASSEPIVEDRGRTPRRRPPRAPSPPPPTPSAPLPTDGVPQAQGKEDKRRRPKRYRERSTSAPLRCVNVDSPVEGSRHASLGPAPALSATISGSSQPGPLPDVKVTQDRQRSLSPQRRERKHRRDESRRDSGFSEFVKIDKAEIPWALNIPPAFVVTPPVELRRERRSKTPRPKDWTFPLELTLEELYHGVTQRFRISFTTPNPGTPPERSVTITIPPGTRPGARIDVGDDIVFEVKQIQHQDFTRVGKYDLVFCVELPWSGFEESELQKGTVSFPGPGGGEVRVDVPESIVAASQGTKVKGKGMPIRKAGKVVGYGDLYVRWEYFVPGNQPQSKWSSLKNALPRFKFDVKW